MAIPNLLVRDSLRSWWCTYAAEHTTSRSRFAHLASFRAGKQCWEELLQLAEDEFGGAEANAREGQSSSSTLNCSVLFQVLKPHQPILECRAKMEDLETFVSELRSEVMSCQIEHVLKADLLLGDLDTSSRLSRERQELIHRDVPEAWVSMPQLQEEPIKDSEMFVISLV